jgi:acyl-CoA thioester hydrolase
MGVVYHTHYLDWFEEARTEALRDVGLPYADLERDGLMMPVVDLSVRYLKPARYDDMVEIVTTIQDTMPRSRVQFEYQVRATESDSVFATGQVTLCFIDTKRGRPISAPPQVREVFSKLLDD